jgi:hypothetical protein
MFIIIITKPLLNVSLQDHYHSDLFNNDYIYYPPPLEMPSGSDIGTRQIFREDRHIGKGWVLRGED